MIAYDAFVITPHDTNDQTFDALYIGGDGNVTIETASGRSVTFTGVTGGTTLPVRGRKVKATGTTATALIGLA